MDFRVFNPFTPSYHNSTLDTCYTKHERKKIHAYGRKVKEVEHATFASSEVSLWWSRQGSLQVTC